MSAGGADAGETQLQPGDVVVSPTPSDDELAAIIAACELLWPEEQAAMTPPHSPRWRFSGRPWARRPRYGGWR